MSFYSFHEKLNKQYPNQLAYDMAGSMTDYRINKTVLTVKPSKHHTKDAVKQKAAENDKRRQLPENTDSRR